MIGLTRSRVLYTAGGMAAGLLLGAALQAVVSGHAQPQQRVFEIRRYTTHDGKLEALNARFRDHTTRLLEKHGMTNIGYWTPIEAPASQNQLIYVLAHRDMESAKKSWDAFRNDPDWKKVRAESEGQGPIVVKVDSMFVQPTDYSALK